MNHHSSALNAVTQGLLTLFLGVLVTAFVGFGVRAFYAPPTAPEYVGKPILAEIEEPRTPAEEDQFQRDWEVFEQEEEVYARNASLIIIGLSVLILILSLTLVRGVLVMNDGLLVGGFLSMIQGIIWAMNHDDPRFTFLIIAAALVVTFTVTYYRFVLPAQAPVAKKVRLQR